MRKGVKLNLFPTDLNLPTSCAILIYENEGDWINWHYDYNYYDGRFFTLLIPISNNLTCTEFQFKNDNNEIKSVNLQNGKRELIFIIFLLCKLLLSFLQIKSYF